jgi:hypothetical protein
LQVFYFVEGDLPGVSDGDGEVVVGPVGDGGGTEMPESEVVENGGCPAGTLSVGVMLMDGTEVVDDTSLPGVTVVSEVVVATVVGRVTVVVEEPQSEPWTVKVAVTVAVTVTVAAPDGGSPASASKFVSCFALR